MLSPPPMTSTAAKSIPVPVSASLPAINAGEVPRKLVLIADVAMYEAKRAGRACSIVFNEAMHTRLARHVTVENSLRRAIGTPELYLVYQPS